MIYERASATHKTPRWAQTLLSRARHPSCVLLDMIARAQMDGVPIAVRYKLTYPETTGLSIKFTDGKGIQILSRFSVNGNPAGCIIEEVPTNADCVLEARATKLHVLRRRLRRVAPDVSEYCLYFERNGRRVSDFEFYVNPQQSKLLLADLDNNHNATSKLLGDDPDFASEEEFFDQPLSRVEIFQIENGTQQFIKIT